MTKELTPRPFHLDGDNDIVAIVDVTLHHVLEADVDGRVLRRVWVEGHAEPKVERDTMTVGLEFALFADGDELGTCKAEPLEIDGDQKTIAFMAEGDLLVPRDAEITRIAMRMTTTLEKSFDPVDLNPQPLPPHTDE